MFEKLNDWLETKNKRMETRADKYTTELKIKKSMASSFLNWITRRK